MISKQTFEEEQLQLLFDVQQASLSRTKLPFSLLFIAWHPSTILDTTDTYETLYTFVAKHSRNNDRVYRHGSKRFIISFLPFSGEDEAQAYFKKLVHSLSDYFNTSTTNAFSLVGTTNEVGNTNFTLQDIVDFNSSFLQNLDEVQQNYAYTINQFSEKEVESIKVSILENNAVAMSIFKNSIQNLNVPYFDLQLQTFEDGLQFIDSSWHNTGHTHIVIVNDTLPFKNGLEIISYLRALPNDEKYIIFLISKRFSEEAIIYAYNSGVDAYFVRPFNIRLLETRLKNVLKRLR